MAQFDLNQPLSWEEEIVEDYDGTVEELSYGLVCGEGDQDREELVDAGHGGVAGQADAGGGRRDGADGQEYHHGNFAGKGVTISDAYGYGAVKGVGADANVNRRGLDLNKIANTRRRTQYTDNDRRAIYNMLLQRNGGSSTMKRGVSKAVAAEMRVPVRVVQRIWLIGRCGGGIHAVVSKKAKNCGRKRIELDPDALRELSMDRRMTIRELAEALRMTKTTVFRRLKEGRLRRPK